MIYFISKNKEQVIGMSDSGEVVEFIRAGGGAASKRRQGADSKE